MRTDPRPLDPPAERPLAGAVLADRYELRALLGRGGMGEVYEAADRRLDRTVAVKVLRPELAADRRFVARFQREARTAARLAHPSIVAVHDAGEHDGRVFIVMEHVAGGTLSDVVGREGPLAPARAARIAADVAEALAHAHARGVVHRDVAPGNVMVGADGRAKVLDFGIARAAQGSAAAGAVLATSTTVHGTLAYAAPELFAGGRGDQRVDVYGLGAVLYELLTGVPPFRGSGERDVARRLAVARPVRVRGWRPDVPAALDELVLRLLARDPAARPDDLDAVASELRSIGASAPAATAPIATATPVVAIEPAAGPRGTAVLPRTTRPLPPGAGRPVDPTAAPPPSRARRLVRSVGRAAAWAALVASVAGAIAVAVPPLVGLTRPVTTRAVPPPVLAPPADLTATASCDGFMSTAASVTWEAVDGADGYELQRRGTGDAAFRTVGTFGADVTAVRDPELGIDTTYRYRVRATDGPEVGAWSRQAEARTPLLCLL